MRMDTPVANGDPTLAALIPEGVTLAHIIALFRAAYHINGEQLLRARLSALGATHPANLGPAELAEFIEWTLRALKSAGVRDPAGSLAHEVRREAEAAAAKLGSSPEIGNVAAQPKSAGHAPLTIENNSSTNSVASPPLEPTLPTPVTTTVESGDVTVAVNETKEPKTETTPRGAMGRKRGRRRGRQDSLEKSLRIIVESLRKSPILYVAAAKAGIHRKTLEYRRKRSEAGDDGYNFEWQGVYWSFHEHCQSAMQEAYDRVLAVAWYIAMGELTDENGKPVPQASWKQRGKMLRFLLEWQLPDKWGKDRKIDVPHNTGVLVVGGIPHDTPKKVNRGTAASVKARKWKAGLRMIKETEV